MAIIANLDVLLGARTATHDAKIKTSATQYTGLRSAVMSANSAISSQMARMATFAAGYLTISKTIGSINNSFNEVDRLAKQSGNLGIAVKELQALELQGKLTGVSAEKMDKALEVLNRRIGEATLGFGEGKRAFDQLRISADRIADTPISTTVGEIADAIDRLETTAQKGAIANQLFGRSGAQMLNFFESGSRGIVEATQFLEKYGLTLDQMGAARVERMNDEWLRTGLLVEGTFNRLSTVLAPQISDILLATQDLASTWQDVATEMDGAARALNGLGLAGPADVLTFAGENVAGYWRDIGNLLSGEVGEVRGPVGNFIDALDELEFAQRRRESARREFERNANQRRADMQDRLAELEKERQARFALLDAIRQQEEAVMAVAQSARDDQFKEPTESLNRLLNSVVAPANSQEEFRLIFGRTQNSEKSKHERRMIEVLEKIKKEMEKLNRKEIPQFGHIETFV